MRGKIPSTGKGSVKTDWDTCELSGDPLLKKYSEFSSLGKTLSTDIPILEKCTSVPLEVNWEVLRETGRTSTSPNTQNFPTEVGVRECFRPRPGWVYAIGDYPQMELRTWSQICLRVLGYSKMAEALNSGMDPHCELARRMLKPQISYEEAIADYKANPKGRLYYPRQASKAGNFGFPGGLQPAAYKEYAWSNYGVAIELELARELHAYWYESWTEAREYFQWVGCQGEDEAMLQLPSFRYRGRCRFTEACNSLFQGLAADAAKAAGFLIARACYAEPESPLYGCRIVNFIHDEFVVEVPDDERAHDAAVELGRLMEVGANHDFIPDVPCKVEPILSRRWSKSAKEVRGPDGRLIPWDFTGGRIAA
jgi:DNA polymerase I-like protein with 3'-5' exonuclease and polymerase domains